MSRPPQYETLSIKRINLNLDSQNTTSGFFYMCDCCNEYASIKVELTKRVKKEKQAKTLKNGNSPKNCGRPKKEFVSLYLCDKHKKELKKLLEYF